MKKLAGTNYNQVKDLGPKLQFSLILTFISTKLFVNFIKDKIIMNYEGIFYPHYLNFPYKRCNGILTFFLTNHRSSELYLSRKIKNCVHLYAEVRGEMALLGDDTKILSFIRFLKDIINSLLQTSFIKYLSESKNLLMLEHP